MGLCILAHRGGGGTFVPKKSCLFIGRSMEQSWLALEEDLLNKIVCDLYFVFKSFRELVFMVFIQLCNMNYAITLYVLLTPVCPERIAHLGVCPLRNGIKWQPSRAAAKLCSKEGFICQGIFVTNRIPRGWHILWVIAIVPLLSAPILPIIFLKNWTVSQMF